MWRQLVVSHFALAAWLSRSMGMLVLDPLLVPLVTALLAWLQRTLPDYGK